MSATRPLPTVDDLLAAFEGGVRIDHGQEQNVRRGSALDLLNGPAAILWAQQADRDRALFRDRYSDSARGPRLETIVERKYGVPRQRATRGEGTAALQRDTAVTAGKVFAGTRIAVRRPTSTGLLFYAVAEDTDVAIGVTDVNVPVRATRTGAGVATTNPASAALEDETFDTFQVVAFACADGFDEEPPEGYLARARRERRDARPGYRTRFQAVCREAGAVHVVILDASDYGAGKDGGVSFVYVADAGFSTPSTLQAACSDAVDDVHIAGCDVQVLPMTPTPIVSLTLGVSLWGSPGDFELPELRQAITSAVLASFNARSEFWLFDLDTVRGEVHAAGGRAIQSVSVATDPAPPAAEFLAVLPYYTLAPSAILITFSGPS